MLKLPGSPEDYHILIVDDEEMNRDMLSRRLQRAGFRCTLAADGFEALDKVEVEDFDLIVLDIMMPRLSGLEVLHTLRKEHDPLALPIVMATAKTETDDIVTALKLGANDYVTKPINFPVVLARLQSILALRGGLRAAADESSRSSAFFEQGFDVQAVLDASGQFTWVSDNVEDVLGWAPDELEEMTLFQLLHPEDTEQVQTHPQRDNAHILCGRLKHLEERWIPCEIATRALRDDETGEVIEVLASIRDVGFRKT